MDTSFKKLRPLCGISLQISNFKQLALQKQHMRTFIDQTPKFFNLMRIATHPKMSRLMMV
jgi:hypothetical protein